MKKLTQNLKWLLLCLLVGVESVAWAETSTVTASKITNSSASWTGSANETWSVSVVGGATGQNIYNGFAQVGTKNSPSSSVTFLTSDISGTITKIEVDCASYNGLGTVSATVGNINFGTQAQSIPSWADNGGTVTFIGSASGAIVITMTNGESGRAMYIKSITVTYSVGGTVKKTANVTIGSSTIEKDGTTNVTTDGPTVELSTSNADIASVSGNTVTGVAAGTATITATWSENEEFYGGSKEFEITVVRPAGYFDFVSKTSDYGSGVSTTSSNSSYITEDKTWVDGNVTLVTSGKYRWWNNDGTLRFYSNSPTSSITLSVPDGYVIKKIQITGGTQWEAAGYNGGTWTGTQQSVTLKYNASTGSINIRTIKVEYEKAANVDPLDPFVSETFVKVTDASSLQAGDEIIFVSYDNDSFCYAMSTTQESNNRGSVVVPINQDYTISSTNGTQVVKLEGSAGAWYFNVGNSQYLYAAGGTDNNYLRTETLENAGVNAKAAIEITTNGVATVTFQVDGTNPRNLLKFNATSEKFSCYRSGTMTTTLEIYKKLSSSTLITEIASVQKLKDFRASVNRGDDYSTVDEVKLIADLDMSGESWTEAIGTADHPFNGKFVGEIYTEEYTNSDDDLTHRYKTRTISNLSGTTGLFGYVESATIEQVALTGVSINSSDGVEATRVDNTGGLVNYSTGNTKISECIVTGSVVGDGGAGDNVGGVVGYASGNIEISSCDVTLNMNGMKNVGGIVGYLENTAGTAKITDCSANKPSGTDSKILANSYVGGIVGKANGPILISKCFNKSQINATASYATDNNLRAYIGGIVGYATGDVSIERSYNKGGLSMNAPGEGGIVGYTDGTVSYCYNTGSLGGDDCIGGIIGIANGATVENSYNNAAVTGNSKKYLGAIVGYADTSNGGHGITASNNYYVISSGSQATDGCGGTIADPSGMAKASDGLLGWVLEGSSFLGDGTSSGDARRWVFVRENAPLLYDVRGQEISLSGNSARNITDPSNNHTFATFCSDVAFTCDDAYWAERIENYKGSRMFVFQQTSILYPSIGDGYMKGYLLKGSQGTFNLVYRPAGEMERVVNTHLTYRPMNYKTNDLGGKEDNSESVICSTNFMYGVGKKTTYDNLYKGEGTIYYLSGNTEDGVTYAVFKTLIPNNNSSIGDNKTYLLTDQNGSSVNVGAKMFNICFNEFVEPEAVLLGDVDVDGAVTVTDVVKMVNVVLNESADDVIMKHGDVNGDGDLDVADVVAIVNKVLGVENDVKSRKVNSVANGGDEASLELNDGVVDFLLSNSSAFCAFQFYMSAEDGLDCKSIILSARAKGHTVSMNKLTDGRYKVMCYSGVNKSFEGSEGELFNILTSGASGKLTLEDLFFVTPGASKVKFGNMDIDVVATGISGIDADENANTIFDLSGRRVQKVQKGVYIVNGKKVIIY